MEETKKTAEGTAAIEAKLDMIVTYLASIHYNMMFVNQRFDKMEHFKELQRRIGAIKESTNCSERPQ